VDGEVTYVGQVPLTVDQVANAIGSAPLATILAPADGVIELDVSPSLDEDVPQFDDADVTDVTLIIGSQHPIDYVF
jgi:hypothetical protein